MGRRESRPTCLYRFYDIHGELLYVGITDSLEGRTAAHRATKPWWDLVATMTVQRFTDRKQAERAERIAIRDEDPMFNVSRPDIPTSVVTRSCTVCLQPVVDVMYPDSDASTEHEQCNAAIVDAYQSGQGLVRNGGR